MWPNPQETADLVTFTEKSLMENFIFWGAVSMITRSYLTYIESLSQVELVSTKNSNYV